VIRGHDLVAEPIPIGDPFSDRVGLVIAVRDSAKAVDDIVAAEAAGVGQIWMTQPGRGSPDALGVFAAAAVRTSRVVMGTAVVPTYPRHPLVLAQQALTVSDLAPGRLRLGIGPSHHATIEGIYGLSMDSPLGHLGEYVALLRGLLWDGKVSYHGRFFDVSASLPRPGRPPILISALRSEAFRLAGAVADGALSWLCPAPYLLSNAIPSLRRGSAAAGRPAPPLIAHITVALSEDPKAVLQAARAALGHVGRMPYYARMFADAGYPPTSEGHLSDGLLGALVISGDEATIVARLRDLLRSGLNELMLSLLPVANESQEAAQLIRLVGRLRAFAEPP
jgi:F420-dependent oxidoreductase-like protein